MGFIPELDFLYEIYKRKDVERISEGVSEMIVIASFYHSTRFLSTANDTSFFHSIESSHKPTQSAKT